MVPQGLDTALRQRERCAAVGITEAIATIQQFGAGGVGEGVVIHPLRRRTTAMAGVDRHAEAVRVGVDQSDLTRRQVGLVLGQVGLADGEQRFFRGERIGMVTTGALITGRRLGQAAAPGGNTASGVTGFFRTQRGELVFQGTGLFGRYGGQAVAGTQAEGDSRHQQGKSLGHRVNLHKRNAPAGLRRRGQGIRTRTCRLARRSRGRTDC